MLQVAFFSERLEHNIGSCEATGLSQCCTQKSHMFLVLSPVIFPLKKSVPLVHFRGERTQGVIQVLLTMRKGTWNCSSYPWDKPKTEAVLSLILPGEF